MSTERFYADLPPLHQFVETTNIDHFVSVPEDWVAIITDIVGSTQAIANGRYKEVNLLGASSIAVILNQAAGIDVPYVFGGDGATILIPPSLLNLVRPALRTLQQIAQAEFKLTLRVGLVPISDILQGGVRVKVAKLQISPHYFQAMLAGGGLNYATQLIKSATTAARYQIDSTEPAPADLTGLECRWQSIPSQHGETLSLIVMATTHHPEQESKIYREVVEKIYAIYGKEDEFHPIQRDRLKLALTSPSLLPETKVRTGLNHWFKQWWYLSQIQIENMLGLVLMGMKLKVGETDWSTYKHLVTTTSDTKKFDDTLRMIISSTSEQRQQLETYLERCYQQGQLVYGIHRSTSALMTCLVFERNGSQVHFVDGAEGGYAIAAKSLKAQLKSRTANWQSHRTLKPVPQKLNP